MTTRQTHGSECDVVVSKDNNELVGTAHIDTVSIRTGMSSEPQVFPYAAIAYIHFKEVPYQPSDYIQLTSGSSVNGEILEPRTIRFTVADSGQTLSLDCDRLLALMCRCHMAASVAEARSE